MHRVKIGQTDYTCYVKLRDTSGNAVTGKVYTDVDIAYSRIETDNDVTTADVTPATLASLTAAHSDWGFLEVSATDHPGLYRLDCADAVFAAGAWTAVVTVTGTGLEPYDREFLLEPTAPYNGVNVYGWLDGSAVATPTVAGVPEVDVTHRLGSAASAEASVAEIANAVWDEAMVAATAVPGVTAAMRDALAYMFALHRNKITQTATTQILYADNGSTPIATSTVSDDGTTATRGEFA